MKWKTLCLGGEYYTLVFVGDDIRKIRQRRI